MSAVTAVATVAVSPAETAAVPSAVGVVTSFIAPVVSPVVPAPVAGETGSRRDYKLCSKKAQFFFNTKMCEKQ